MRNQSWSTALGSSLQSNGMLRGWEPGAGRAEAVRGNAAAFSSRAVQGGCRSTRPCPHPHPQPRSTLLQSSLGAGITQACSNAWGSAHDFCIPPTLPSVPLGSLPHAPLLLLQQAWVRLQKMLQQSGGQQGTGAHARDPLPPYFPLHIPIFQLSNLPGSLFISKRCAGREQQADLLGRARLL